MKYHTENLRREVKRMYPYFLCIMNLLSVFFGIAYLSLKGRFGGNIYGIIMLLVFFGNIFMGYETEKRKLGYGYLVLSMICMFVIPICNILVSIQPKNTLSQSIISIGMIFVLLLYGGLMAGLCIPERDLGEQDRDGLEGQNWRERSGGRMESNWEKEISQRRGRRYLRNTAMVFLSLMLISGLYPVILILSGFKYNILEFVIPGGALFYALMYLSLGVYIQKLLKRRRAYVLRTILRVITILIVITCMLPFLSIPKLEISARREYIKAFGDEFLSQVKEDGGEGMRKSPFILADYFWGIPSNKYKIKENILFYEGRTEKEEGLMLYYDVYLPEGKRENLPVLIRIHGGSWSAGDKGMLNFAQMNKYFASAGYAVFDLQYGLKEKEKGKLLPSDKKRSGGYEINDMVGHIGAFLKHLEQYKGEYGVDLDCVFLSGGSAGGQLAVAVGLELSKESPAQELPAGIRIRGMIPFYPAIGLSAYLEIEGRPDWVDPGYMVDSNSPPCLIFQGDRDGYVDGMIIRRFQSIYRRNQNTKCAVLTMPFAGHGSDLYFAGYYNQVMLYYMERMMGQYK